PFRDIAAGEQSHRGRDSLARGQRAQFPQAATRFSSAERGKGRCPFPRSPIPKTALQRFPTPHHSWIEPASTSLRTISLGDSEHLLHNHHVSVAALRLLFTFAPECRSASSGIDVHLHRNTHACKSQPTIFMCSAPFLRCLVGLSAPSLLGRGEPTRLSNQAPFLRSLVGLSAPSLLGRGEPTRLSNEALSRRSYRSPRPAAEISRWRFRHLRAAVRSPALGSIVFGSIVGCAFLAGVVGDFSIRRRSWVDIWTNSSAAFSVSLAPRDVFSAAWATPAILLVISPLLRAASLTLRAISLVVASCCSTAVAIVPEISLTWLMTAPIDAMASTAALLLVWMAPILRLMSSVALAVALASSFTSLATTAKPLPASPARAASMVAF